MFFQFSHLWNTQRRFFGLLLRCGYADNSWEFWILILVFIFLKYCFFLCSSLMRFFVVQVFFIFQDSVWLVKKTWCVHCCSIHPFYWVSHHLRGDLRCGDFCPKKIVVTVLAVFLSFWYWLPDITWVFIKLKDNCLFGVDNVLFIY